MVIFRWIVEHVEISGLVIDFISLIVSIILAVGIYRLERRHEKESKKNEIVEMAKGFLIDNDEEIDYLPLAAIASKLKLKRKHSRKLITRFLRCNEQLQQEILRQVNIPDIQITTAEVKKALYSLEVDLEKNQFGRNILYDGEKYFHRAFSRWSEKPVNDINPYIFKNLIERKCNNQQENPEWLLNCESSLYSYMLNYHNSEKIEKEKIVSPIDMVFQLCNLESCEESIMTFWTMRIIIDACQVFNSEPNETIFDEGLIQTQEDMYYYTLAVLNQTYGTRKDYEV